MNQKLISVCAEILKPKLCSLKVWKIVFNQKERILLWDFPQTFFVGWNWFCVRVTWNLQAVLPLQNSCKFHRHSFYMGSFKEILRLEAENFAFFQELSWISISFPKLLRGTEFIELKLELLLDLGVATKSSNSFFFHSALFTKKLTAKRN